MIEFFQVRKVYPNGIEALKGLTFRVEKGEFVILTGPSGAGKSTLLKILLCIEKMTSGEVLLGGKNIGKLKKSSIPFLRRNIGMVFQDFKLLNSRTVYDNIAIALEIQGLFPSVIRKRVDEILEQVSLSRYKKEYPLSLSGGEQQRVAIARALVNNPPIILADEPTGNLDPDLTFDIMKILKRVNNQGTTVMIATHNPTIIKTFGQRILTLEHGSLAMDSAVDTDLSEDAREDSVQSGEDQKTTSLPGTV